MNTTKAEYTDPYDNLANAIVLTAANDYRAAVSHVKKDPNNSEAWYEVRKLEDFFRSQRYMILTKVEGEYLIRRLREEVLA